MSNTADTEFEPLMQQYDPISGFLLVPRKGDQNPKQVRFEGIVKGAVSYKDERGQEKIWYSCKATKDLDCEAKNDETGELFQVKNGMNIGISETGAIRGLRKKVGYRVRLTFTGKPIEVKNGTMLEVLAEVGKKPVADEGKPEAAQAAAS
jgi:hypothetical protein